MLIFVFASWIKDYRRIQMRRRVLGFREKAVLFIDEQKGGTYFIGVLLSKRINYIHSSLFFYFSIVSLYIVFPTSLIEGYLRYPCLVEWFCRFYGCLLSLWKKWMKLYYLQNICMIKNIFVWFLLKDTIVSQISVEDVMKAIHLKSFDYRVLNLLLYQLRREEVIFFCNVCMILYVSFNCSFLNSYLYKMLT